MRTVVVVVVTPITCLLKAESGYKHKILHNNQQSFFSPSTAEKSSLASAKYKSKQH